MKKVIYCVMFILVTLVQSLYVVYATGNIHAHEVIYNNSTSGLGSSTVNGAIQELYESSIDYSSFQQNITNLSNNKIDLASPQMSGVNHVPTSNEIQTFSNSTAPVANTAFVQDYILTTKNGLGTLDYVGATYENVNDISTSMYYQHFLHPSRGLGKYIIFGSAQFSDTSTSGYRMVYVKNANGNIENKLIQCKTRERAAQSSYTLLSFACIVNFDDDYGLLYAKVEHDANVTFSKIDTRLYALKID